MAAAVLQVLYLDRVVPQEKGYLVPERQRPREIAKEVQDARPLLMIPMSLHIFPL